MIKYRHNMVSPVNLFFMLFVCRTLIGFTVSTSVLKSKYSVDLLISMLIGLVAVLLLSVPIIKLLENDKNLLNNKTLSTLYGIYFIYSGAISVSKFALFSSTELNQNAKTMFLAAFMIAACVYAASLGIEAVARFGSMVFVITILGIGFLFLFGIKEFSLLNLFPLIQNDTESILKNALFSASSTSEIVLLLALSPKINGKIKKPFYLSLVFSFIAGMVLIFTAIGILGDTASLSPYPLFEVSQISKFASNERLDSVFTAFWIFAVFLKSTLYLYSSAYCIKGKSHSKKCIAVGVSMFAVSWFILKGRAYDQADSSIVLYIPFIVFAVIIPLLYLIFGKKRKPIENIEDI